MFLQRWADVLYRTDPYFTMWESGTGIYTTNGALLGVLMRSNPNLTEPDLYVFALP